MARPPTIEDAELLIRMGEVFRRYGYDGATLRMLADAAGLKQASLYYRFPGGKEQIALEVMACAGAWFEEQILGPLRGDAPPRERIARMADKINDYYGGGAVPCPLNMLSTPAAGEELRGWIRHAFESWLEAMARAVMDAGIDEVTARARAERVMAMLQGSLVLASGMGTTAPFAAFLEGLEDELLRPAA